MAIKTKKMSDWLAQNGQAITNASKESMLQYIDKNLLTLQDGVYIVDKDDDIPRANTLTEWENTPRDKAVGILLIDGTFMRVLGVDFKALSISSKEFLSGNEIDTTEYAINDFNGKDNTNKIIAASNDSVITNTENYAAGYCKKYSIVNNKGYGFKEGEWWLPSLGELLTISANINKVIKAYKILNIDFKDLNLWASTSADSLCEWYINLGTKKYYRWNHKTNFCIVLPITSYIY